MQGPTKNNPNVRPTLIFEFDITDLMEDAELMSDLDHHYSGVFKCIQNYFPSDPITQACQTQSTSRAANETKTAERATKLLKNPKRAIF